MSTTTADPEATAHAYDPAVDAPKHHHPVYDYDSGPPVDRGKFAIWLFLATEVMFFTGLIGTYIVIRMGTPMWPDPMKRLAVDLTAANTFLLITSSWFMVKSIEAAKNDNQSGVVKWLVATILGGALFAGVQAYEYYKLIGHGDLPNVDLFWSTFYAMTGFHGLHVVAGVIWLICLLRPAMKGKFTSKNFVALELGGLYWHFVDLVWVLLFTIVYLM